MLKKSLNSSYFKNILTLSWGTIIAQLILLLSQPFITRIYGDIQIGYYELLFSIYAIFSNIICLRYDLTIVSAENDEEAKEVFITGAIVALCFSIIITLFLVILIKMNFSALKTVGYSSLLVPLWTVVVGLNSLLTSYNNRKNQYKLIVYVLLLRSSVMCLGQIALGFLWPNYIVLIFICIIAECCGIARQCKYAFGNEKISENVDWNSILAVAKKYKKQPLLSTPAIIMNSLAFSGIVLFIEYYYKNISNVAFYALAYRIVGLPATFIGNSVGKVFYSKVCEEWNNARNFTKTLVSTVIGLSIISIAGFTILFLLPNTIYAFIFGDGWEPVGGIIKIMIPFCIVRTVASPVSLSIIVTQKQHLEILMQFGLLFFIAICAIVAYFFNLTFLHYLILNTIALTIVFLVWIIMFFYVSKGKRDDK